jgi:glycosyltransferase involved in cell wall biosynthesis
MKLRRKMDITIASFYGRYGDFPEENRGIAVLGFAAATGFSAKAVLALHEWIRRERPDFVHIHHWPSGLWGALFGRFYGAAVVKTEHNDLRFASWRKRVANCAIYPLLSRLICNSRTTQQSLNAVEGFAIGDRAMTIHNGVDFSGLDADAAGREPARAELNLQGEFLLGTVGRFVPQKNHLALLRAFALVPSSNVKLLLIGDGPLRAALEAEILRLGISQRVILIGAVSRSRVYRYLRAMDGFIMPSLWEGFCNAAVEAAGAGVPVIASDIATLREVLGSAAQLFNQRDNADIARAIGTLAATNRTELARSAQALRAFVRNRYDIDRACETYEDVFQTLIRRRRDRVTRNV